MPSLHELKHSLGGIWLLVKGDARGLSAFDISNRGVLRSFWAFVWCLPATLVIWYGRRQDYLVAHMQDADGVGPFAARMAVVELAQWLVPTLAIALIALVLGLRPLARILVITWNWFSVPLVYAASIIDALDSLVPMPADKAGFIGVYGTTLLTVSLLIASIALNWRLLRTIVGGPVSARLALLTFTIAAEITLVSLLEVRLGLSVPW